MKKFGLTGNPLGHSISPEIHEKLWEIKKVKAVYDMYETTDVDKTYNEELKKLDGFNITIPYKVEIIKHLDEKSPEVEFCNACNTVVFKNGKVKGYNTDVTGFTDCFFKNGISFKDKNILVTGAGGVSSMMAYECSRQGGNVFITCRDEKKAQVIIDGVYEKLGKKIEFVNKEDIKDIDILLQGTPVGMYPKSFSSYVPLDKLKDIKVVFDTIYNPYKTLTIRVCEYYGNFAMGGLHMLVSQGAKAQEIWQGLSYDSEEISRVIAASQYLVPEFKMNKNIILIGAPGSGKTTISREISKILDLKNLDTDLLIEQKEKRKISDIFEKDGEEYFRNLESNEFFKCLEKTGNVIATGGGLPEFNDLTKIDKDKNIVVFIDVSVDELYRRVCENNDRPLLCGDKKTLIENIVKRRYNIYDKSADFKITVEKDDNLKDIVVKIIEMIKDRY